MKIGTFLMKIRKNDRKNILSLDAVQRKTPLLLQIFQEVCLESNRCFSLDIVSSLYFIIFTRIQLGYKNKQPIFR